MRLSRLCFTADDGYPLKHWVSLHQTFLQCQYITKIYYIHVTLDFSTCVTVVIFITSKILLLLVFIKSPTTFHKFLFIFFFFPPADKSLNELCLFWKALLLCTCQNRSLESSTICQTPKYNYTLYLPAYLHNTSLALNGSSLGNGGKGGKFWRHDTFLMMVPALANGLCCYGYQQTWQVSASLGHDKVEMLSCKQSSN